jgi:hypothetical protein
MAKVFPYSNLGRSSSVPLGLERFLRMITSPEVIDVLQRPPHAAQEVKVTYITSFLEGRTP